MRLILNWLLNFFKHKNANVFEIEVKRYKKTSAIPKIIDALTEMKLEKACLFDEETAQAFVEAMEERKKGDCASLKSALTAKKRIGLLLNSNGDAVKFLVVRAPNVAVDDDLTEAIVVFNNGEYQIQEECEAA